MRRLESITNSVNMNLSELWEIVEDSRAWCDAVHWGCKDLDMKKAACTCYLCLGMLTFV